MRRTLVAAIGLWSCAAAHAAGAPQQALNKTITISWVVQTSLIGGRGQPITRTANQHRVMYVSSAGRIFVKSRVNARTAEIDPGAPTPAGEARDVRFQGGQLVAIAAMNGGRVAGRAVVSFDPSFTSCSLNVTIGRAEGAPVTKRGPRGGVVTVMSQSISGQTCSIRSGNAFAE